MFSFLSGIITGLVKNAFLFFFIRDSGKREERRKTLEKSNKLLKKYQNIDIRGRDLKSTINRLRRKSSRTKDK